MNSERESLLARHKAVRRQLRLSRKLCTGLQDRGCFFLSCKAVQRKDISLAEKTVIAELSSDVHSSVGKKKAKIVTA